MKFALIVAISALFALSSADFISESLAANNKYRAEVGVPALVWNASLAQSAQAWADNLARTRVISHSKNRVNIGENLAWGTASTMDVEGLVDLWGAEGDYFVAGRDYPKCTSGSESDVWHYTQMIWQKSTQLGCGMGSSNGRLYYVCQYYPRGNMYGEPVYTATSTPSQPVTQPSTPVVTEPSTPVTTEPSTPVTTEPSTPEQPQSSTSQSNQDAFISESLTANNNWRAAVGVGLPNLVWNTTLAQSAQAWADHLASTKVISHSQNRVNTGENLAWGTANTNDITGLVGLWGAEEKYFVAGPAYPKCTSRYESDVWHYTQMIWRKSTQVGCGMGSSNGELYYVCQYYPRGNMYGQSVY